MEERKLKYMYQRMPKKTLSYYELKKVINEKTGYPAYQIDEILAALTITIEEAMIDRKAISLPHIGKIYPTIKPGKNVVSINKFETKDAELMYMPARWTCKFKPLPQLAKKLLEISPTKEEIDNIYR